MWIIFIVILLLVFFYGSYSIRNSFYVKSLCGIRTEKRIVSISFDDGIDAIQTPKVLDVLRDFKVKATFFIIGSKVEGNEKILKRIVYEGHQIGNHSFSHKSTFPLLSYKNMLIDVNKTKEILDEYAETKFFRPPFGVTNPTIARVISQLGYISIGWNIRSLDTQNTDIYKVYNRILRRVKGGDIILLHDRLTHSEELLRKLLIFLRDNSYVVVSLDELIAE